MNAAVEIVTSGLAGQTVTDSVVAKLALRVRSVRWECEDILRYELVAPDGGELPAWRAGAHLDVHVAPGLVRQYSLCGDVADRHRYEFAVLKESAGRGGSVRMHDTVHAGAMLTVSEPRNHFPLAATATRHVLVAGGIGVTPMIAMIGELQAAGADWHLHCCTRSPQRTAFADELAPLAAAGRVTFHHDGGDPSRGMDLVAELAGYEPGTHLYHCGPSGFMAAVARASSHWPPETVHCEYFAAPTTDAGAARPANHAFSVQVGRGGEVLEVPADRTIVDVLREHGHYVDTSCEEGYCGTCLTPYLEGEPEHRDTVLDDQDRARYVLICCARSKTPKLVLDL